MQHSDSIADYKLPLTYGGAGMMPALGFGTLIHDAAETRSATRTALEIGFRHLDCAERYRNEAQVGVAIQEAIQAGWLNRNQLFATTKLWHDQDPRHHSNRHLACYRGTRRIAQEKILISVVPADAMEEINSIPTRQRFNLVTATGIPGFISKAG